MPRRLLYATTNPGKVMEVRRILAGVGLEILVPPDLGLALEVPEDGTSLEANAAAKARAYLDHLDGDEFVVLGDDTGVEIDALGGEPGIHVRRWTGQGRLSDQEVLDTCLTRMAGIPPAQRGAQFRTVFAIGAAGREPAFFDGVLRGVILEQADPLRIEGFPFESVFFVPEWGLVLGAIHFLPPEQKAPYVTHRERALMNALPHLRALLDE